uniref:Uncharacterized protein n=1 Tax=Cannabis sativa TaxID=3483 RepID=A0A803NKC3_CANSA
MISINTKKRTILDILLQEVQDYQDLLEGHHNPPVIIAGANIENSIVLNDNGEHNADDLVANKNNNLNISEDDDKSPNNSNTTAASLAASSHYKSKDYVSISKAVT